MTRKSSLRIVFGGAAGVVFGWWATDNLTFPYEIEWFCNNYGLVLLSALVVIFGLYKFTTAPKP